MSSRPPGAGSALQAGVAEEVLVPARLPDPQRDVVPRLPPVRCSPRTSAFIIGSKQFKIHTIQLCTARATCIKVPAALQAPHAPRETEEMCRNMTLLFNTAYHLALEGPPYLDFRPLAGLLTEVRAQGGGPVHDEETARSSSITSPGRCAKTWWSASARVAMPQHHLGRASDDLQRARWRSTSSTSSGDGPRPTRVPCPCRSWGSPAQRAICRRWTGPFQPWASACKDEKPTVGLGMKPGASVTASLRASMFMTIRRRCPGCCACPSWCTGPI